MNNGKKTDADAIQSTLPESNEHATAFDIAEFLQQLTAEPGVYRMLGVDAQVLYVGKAKNLKRRVSSYFQKNHGPRMAQMVKQIVRIEVTVTHSEAEALLLENNLIKSLSPKYNILFRDDKSYPYLRISNHAFPRLSYYRGAVDKKSQYFGPFPSAWAVRESIQILQRVFLLRNCEDTIFANRSRPCLQAQIGRCSAPCVNHISAEDYAQDVARAVMFLKGDHQTLLQQLEHKMLAASNVLAFEQAALYRNQISALSAILQKQSVDTTGRDDDVDVLAVVQHEGMVCVNLAMVRGGRHLGDRAYFPAHLSNTPELQDDVLEAVLEAFISQMYIERAIPAGFISNIKMQHTEAFKALQAQAGKALTWVLQPQGQRRQWLVMTERNALLAITRKAAQKSTATLRLQALLDVLGIKPLIADEDAPVQPDDIRIECFDISHMAGENTVASCVVYHHQAMQAKQYRRYTISDITPGDDYAAMRQAVLRRYQQISMDGDAMPDVVLIDGGVGQISSVQSVFEDLGLPLHILVGVKKGDHRKVGLETLVFADGREPLSLGETHPALMLIAEIRDEAHRFAITGMRTKRAKVQTASALDEIDGIGPVRKKKLLARFGGLAGVKKAGIQDLQSVDGISSTLAEEIYRRLHG